jgi:hypothetical protein
MRGSERLNCVVPDEVLTHISPLGTRHLIFNGDYIWEAPLRAKMDSESAKNAL